MRTPLPPEHNIKLTRVTSNSGIRAVNREDSCSTESHLMTFKHLEKCIFPTRFASGANKCSAVCCAFTCHILSHGLYFLIHTQCTSFKVSVDKGTQVDRDNSS